MRFKTNELYRELLGTEHSCRYIANAVTLRCRYNQVSLYFFQQTPRCFIFSFLKRSFFSTLYLHGVYMYVFYIWKWSSAHALGASVVWHHSLPLINSFNKTEAAVFSCRLCFLRAFPFISLVLYSKFKRIKTMIVLDIAIIVNIKDIILNWKLWNVHHVNWVNIIRPN